MRTVHIYSGSLALVSKSGVGQAAKHQRAALESVGVHVVTDWDCRAEVVHINTVLPVSLWAARHARRRGQKVIWYGHSTEKDLPQLLHRLQLAGAAFQTVAAAVL